MIKDFEFTGNYNGENPEVEVAVTPNDIYGLYGKKTISDKELISYEDFFNKQQEREKIDYLTIREKLESYIGELSVFSLNKKYDLLRVPAKQVADIVTSYINAVINDTNKSYDPTTGEMPEDITELKTIILSVRDARCILETLKYNLLYILEDVYGEKVGLLDRIFNREVSIEDVKVHSTTIITLNKYISIFAKVENETDEKIESLKNTKKKTKSKSTKEVKKVGED